MKANKRNATANTFTGSSWAICATLACCFVVDAGIALTLLITGMGWRFAAMPLIAALVDLAFFFVALMSNFRFRYGLIVYLLYTIIYYVVCSLTMAFTVNGDIRYMTLASQVFWAVVHFVALVVMLVTYVYSAKSYRKSKLPATIVVSVFLAVMVLAAGWYGIMYSQLGYLGQGFEGFVRPIEYRYDAETDSYHAIGLLDGKGGTVKIVDTYDDKPVTDVDCGIFATKGISYVSFEGSVSYRLSGIDKLSSVDKNLHVQADQEIIDEVKNMFYDVYSSDRQYAAHAFRFANGITPNYLNGNQVYITFAYSVDTFDRLGGFMFDTWLGTKGDTFNVSEYEKLDFFTKSDAHDNDDLHWGYTHNNGYIFNGLTDDSGASLNGKQINKSYTVTVDFAKIYRVTVGDDNDELYETANSYKQTSVGAQTLNYRYVVPSTANELLNNLPKRQGFDVSWEYSYGSSSSHLAMTDFASVLQSATGDSVVIYPKWQMKAPVVSLTSGASKSVMYGEDTTFSVNALPADSADFNLSYNWTKKSGAVDIQNSNTASATIENIPYDAGGEYVCTVTCKSSGSSLSAQATVTVNVTVTKRQVTVEWSELSLNKPSGTQIVYNATNQQVSCQIKDGDVINRDILTLSVSVDNGGVASGQTVSMRNAGTYKITVTLAGDDDGKYEIAIGKTQSYTIAKKLIEQVNWVATCAHVDTHTYDAQAHGYTATVMGEGSDGTIALEYNGANTFTNAGNNYTVSAHLPASYAVNYELKQGINSKTFNIAAKAVTVSWGDTFTFTYDGASHTLSPRTDDLLNNDGLSVALSATAGSNLSGGKAVNVGSYSVAVSCGSNYEIVNEKAQSFSITAKPVTVDWDVTNWTVTYDGQQHTFTAKTDNLVSSDEWTVTITDNSANRVVTYAKNVGSYTVKAEIKSQSNRQNYSLSNDEKTFTVNPLSITLDWTNTRLEYNGLSQKPTASHAAVGLDNLTFTVTLTEGTALNVGTYHATATVSNSSIRQNYTLTNATQELEIYAKEITVTVTASRTEFTQRVTVDSLKEYLACEDSAHKLVSGHRIDSSSVVYSIIGDQSGDGVKQLEIDATGIKIVNGSTDVTSNYRITVVKAMITVTLSSSEDELTPNQQNTILATLPKEIEYVL